MAKKIIKLTESEFKSIITNMLMEEKYQTGFFGKITKGKVVEFQESNKDADGKDLNPDGIVGPRTYGALKQ